jgi:MFS superfamily sulfate permease-like transporter
VPNALAGLTVSFPAVSLGAAFGILARPPQPGQLGGGALKGILSAGLIALVTGAGGGTKVQCSGVTAPMATVFAQISDFAQSGGCRDVATRVFMPEFSNQEDCDASEGNTWEPDGFRAEYSPDEVNPDAFLNTVLLLTGICISLLGLLRAGRFIAVRTAAPRPAPRPSPAGRPIPVGCAPRAASGHQTRWPSS